MPTRKWGSEQLVNTALLDDQVNSDVAGLTGGGFVVVWQDGATTGAAIRGQRYDALGSRVGGEILVVFGGSIDQLTPSVTGLADGGFFVSWDGNVSSNRDILGKVYDSNGAFVREQRPTPIETPPDQSDPDVARLGAGSVAVWVEPGAGDTDIRARIFGGDGSIVNTFAVTSITGREEHEPAVASAPSGNQFVVVWTSEINFGDVFAGVFDAAGNANPVARFAVNVATGPQSEPVVTWLNDNRFVVAWRDESQVSVDQSSIRARIFNQFGQPLTDEIAVNATTIGHQVLPTIAALPSGGFVIAWMDLSEAGGDGSDSAIRLQAFDASGGKIGGEFLVNTTTTSGQEAPAISALPDGRVVVTWTDFSSGNADIQMQIIDPRDGIVTGTGGHDTLYGHNSVGDEISGFAGNDVMRGLKGNDELHGGEGNDAGDGGHGDDALYGSTGNDNLSGRLGDDDLFGESGSDLLNGGAGADLLHGGPGLDTASYAAGGAVNVSLDGSFAATGEAAGDVFIFVEHLQGSNAGSDILRGNGGGNTLSGLGGNDVVQGMAGNDIVYGGLGADNLSGGANNDTFLYNALTEIGDIIQDFATIDQFLFRGTAFANLPAGTLAPTAFQASLTSGAANPNIRFIFETDQTILWFDANGSTGGGPGPVMVANLQIGATMTNADIVIF